MLSLFHTATDTDVLGTFSAEAGTPAFLQGRSAADWTALLDRATGLGLLTALGAGMYGLHPALPAFLAGQWQQHRPHTYPAERAAAQTELLTAHAALARWLVQQIDGGDAEVALTVLHVHRHTLGAMLDHALDNARPDAGGPILQALDTYWTTAGLRAEADGWTDRILQATETPDGRPPDLDTPAGRLWILTVGTQASRHINAHHLDAAEATYRRVSDMLTTQPDSPTRSNYLATTHHQLGRVAQQRGELDAAEHWYQQSLTITEQLGNRPYMASTYHQLGRIAQDRGELDTAEHWYQQSLTITEQLGNRPGMARTYHQLGIVAQDRGELDTAERWYQQSLTIKEQLGDRPGMARTYHQLGIVAQQRGELDAAERWYQQSLTINEQLGNRPGLATSYHQLGRIAQRRGELDTAEHWYQQALTINEQLGNRPDLAQTYGQLGLLAEDRGTPETALEWTIRAITLFPNFPHPATGPAPHHLARLTTTLGWTTLHTTWQHTTGQPTPTNVTAYIQAIHDEGTTT